MTNAPSASPPSLGPLPLRPILHARAWGGDRLPTLRPGAAMADGGSPTAAGIGESWELADLPAAVPGGRSEVAAGPHAGRTLHDLLATREQAILGLSRRRADGGFPLLLKLLDSRETLSIQVHPDPAYAANHPGCEVKHEGWFVIDAAPGARILRGFTRPLDRREIAARVRDGSIRECLAEERLGRGDFVWLPSGTCHALGEGLLVAEVQTPSDTTFRLDDWGRSLPERPLHREQAIESIDGRAASELPPIRRLAEMRPIEADGFRTYDLHRSPWFSIELLECEAGAALPLRGAGTAVAWMLLDGEVELASEDPARGGDAASGEPPLRLAGTCTVLLPAALPPTIARFGRPSRLLRVPLAHPAESMLAEESPR